MELVDSMAARVAPVALRARRAAGLASGCALPKRLVMADMAVVAGSGGLGLRLALRLVFELVGGAFPGRDVGTLGRVGTPGNQYARLKNDMRSN